MPALKVYLEVGSPYSYVALEILARYKDIWGLPMHLIPVSAGGIFKATGNAFHAVSARRQHNLVDLQRVAKTGLLDIRGLPSNFGTSTWNTLPALRVLTAAAGTYGDTSSQVLALFKAFFRAVFVEHAGSSCTFEPPLLLQCCRQAGLSHTEAQQLLAASTAPEVKRSLKAATDEVLQEGAFGVPSIVVIDHPDMPPGQRLFFGSDRFEQLAALLGRPWFGPVPPAPKL